MLRTFIFFSLVLLLSACNNEPKKQTPPPPPPAPEAPAATSINLPMIPAAEMQNLFSNCDFIDYTFYDPRLPMSISLNEISSIQATLGHVAQEPPKPTTNCKALGRIFYQSQGDYILEAEFYFKENCTYFVFFKDGKATYANAMAPSGITFFTNNIQQAINAVSGGK